MPELGQEYGCNWRSCLGIAETFMAREFDLPTLLRLYDESIAFGFMNDHCIVRWPGRIITLGLRNLDGIHWTAYDVATSTAPEWTIDWYGWVKVARKFCLTASTLCGKTLLKNEHWREGDAGGHFLWDPHTNATVDKELRKVYFRIEERW